MATVSAEQPVSGATSFSGTSTNPNTTPLSKYGISQLVYPDRLNLMMDKTSFVIFYVLVDNESKLLPGDTTNGDGVSGLSQSMSQAKQMAADVGSSISAAASNIPGAGVVSSIFGGLGTGLGTIGSDLASLFGSGGTSAQSATTDIQNSLMSTSPGTTNSITKDLKNGLASTFMSSSSRLKISIALPMPNDFGTAYTAGWQEGESNLLIDTLADPNGVANAAKTLKDPKAVGKMAGGALATFIGKAMPAQQKITGIVTNPRKTQLFNSMAMREFTFNYTFAPQSVEEYGRIQQIIGTFKYYMHPEWVIDQMGTNSPFLRVPSEFNIEFRHAAGENGNLNKISTCVLKSCTVHYTPGGTWSKHSNGAPSQIAVSLVFAEMEMMTKERIAQGY